MAEFHEALAQMRAEAPVSGGPALLQRVRETLLSCRPFADAQALQAIFVDDRIRPWRDQLPGSGSYAQQVDGVIALLLDRRNDKGENALVLFLQVLSERIDPGDACSTQLARLAWEVELHGVA